MLWVLARAARMARSFRWTSRKKWSDTEVKIDGAEPFIMKENDAMGVLVS